MKRKAVSMILAVTMVATMAVGCGGSKTETADTTAPADDAAAEETTEADAADAEDTADAAADAVDGDLSDKKVGVLRQLHDYVPYRASVLSGEQRIQSRKHQDR